MKKILCLSDEAFECLDKLLDATSALNHPGRNELVGEVLFGPRRNAAVVNSTIDELVQNAESFLGEYGPGVADHTWEEYEARALSAPRRLARICDADEARITLRRDDP